MRGHQVVGIELLDAGNHFLELLIDIVGERIRVPADHPDNVCMVLIALPEVTTVRAHGGQRGRSYLRTPPFGTAVVAEVRWSQKQRDASFCGLRDDPIHSSE